MADKQPESNEEPCRQEPPDEVPRSHGVKTDAPDEENLASSSNDEETTHDQAPDNGKVHVVDDLLLEARGSSSNDQGISQEHGSSALHTSSADSLENQRLDEYLEPPPSETEEMLPVHKRTRSGTIEDEINEKHEDLIDKLCKEMSRFNLFENMKNELNGGDDGLLSDEWEDVKTPMQMMCRLQGNGTIGIGNYGTLIGVFWRINQKSIIRLIERYQRSIHEKEFHKGRPLSNDHRGNAYDIKRSRDNKKGILVVINQFTHTREGTMEDETSLLSLFKSLDFFTQCYNDLSRQSLKEKLRDVRKLIEENEYSQLFLAMLSHGSQGGIQTCEPKGKKKRFITIEELTKEFTSSQCKTLRGNPKFFLIEACRGNKEMQKFEYDANSDIVEEADSETAVKMPESKSLIVSTPAESDVLICYSQLEGYKSIRCTSGTWFIQTFCKIVERNHDCSHIQELMTMVNKEVAEKSQKSKDFPKDPVADVGQMPCQLSTLTKVLYL